MSNAEHIGNGYTTIYTSELGRDSGHVPVIILKLMGKEVKRIAMKHMLFNSERDAADFARHAHKNVRVA